MSDLFEMATEYTISAVPLGDMDSDMFAIKVQIRSQMDGAPLWAVCLRSNVLTRSGRWVYEPRPSSRTDAFLRRTRFDLETALRLARKAAPKVRGVRELLEKRGAAR